MWVSWGHHESWFPDSLTSPSESSVSVLILFGTQLCYFLEKLVARLRDFVLLRCEKLDLAKPAFLVM